MIGKALKIIVAVSLLALLFISLDWRAALVRLADSSPAWVALACLFNILAIVVSAYRWRKLVIALDIDLDRFHAIRLYWIGTAFNKVMPSTVGGDVVRIAMSRHLGSLTLITSSLLFERLTGFWFLGLFGFGALVSIQGDELAPPYSGAMAWLLGFGLIAGPLVLMCLPKTIAALTDHRTGMIQKLGGFVCKLTTSLVSFSTRPKVVMINFVLIAIFYAIIFTLQGVLILAVGGKVTPSMVMIAAPLVLLIASLPISINGIGLAEGAFVALYAYLGVDPDTALAAALLRRVVITVVAMIGLPFWLAERGQPPVSGQYREP